MSAPIDTKTMRDCSAYLFPKVAERLLDSAASEIDQLREVVDDLLTFFPEGDPARVLAEKLLPAKK